MPKKFIYKPKTINLVKPSKKNYNTSKIVKPSNSYNITQPKKSPITRIKPTNNTKLVKPNKYTIVRPKKSPITRIKPKSVTKLVKPSKKKIKRKRIYKGRVDQSLPTLKRLLQIGYDVLTFEARNTACPICQGLNGYTFDLKFWLGQLKHSSPIFEISHVQCLDYVRVWDSENILPPLWVNWTGNYFEQQP